MHRACFLALGALLVGCTGSIGDSAADGAGDNGHTPSADVPSTAAFTPAPGGIRRLTVAQYSNTVRDLLGEAADVPADIPAVESGPYGFATISAAQVEVAGVSVEKFDAVARDLAKKLVADPERRATVVSCDPAEGTCIDSFLRRFGRRAYRRPLSDAELTAYRTLITDVAAEYGDTWSGIEHALAAMLQAPSFLYISELGVAEAGVSARRYDNYEMAARLSFFLWNTTPDDALLDAAGRGELSTREGIRAAARRLLTSKRAHAAVRAYFAEQLKIDRMEEVSKSAEVFPTWSPSLGRSMRMEVESVLERVVFEGADFRSVLDTRDTFVDANLATLYGLPIPTAGGMTPARLPEGARAGLLGFAGIMAASARETETSPTRRGLFIRDRLLCLEIPPPPASLGAAIAEEQTKATTGAHRTMRDRLERQRTDSQCAGCHRLMDPPGLALEHFDGIGAYRKDDRGLPIDASGDLDGKPFDGALGLSLALRDDPRFGRCMTRQVYRFASGHVDGPGETVVLDSLSNSFAASGYRFAELLVEIVASDGFRFAGDAR